VPGAVPLRPDAKPGFATISKIMGALGMRMVAKPVKAKRTTTTKETHAPMAPPGQSACQRLSPRDHSRTVSSHDELAAFRELVAKRRAKRVAFLFEP